MNFIDEIEALFDIYENEEFLTEEEIFERCIGVAQKYSWNRDVLFDLNDSLNFHGYTYQFKIEKEKRREFDINTYSSLIKNVKKSKNKTKELISYLAEVNNHSIWFASLYALKMEHIINLGYFDYNLDFKKILMDYKDLSYQDMMLFCAVKKYKQLENTLINTLIKMGFKYLNLNYMEFRYDMEKLLWSIELKDSKKGYIKVNTIKAALNICPKDLFERDNKYYYNPDIVSSINKYLKEIDKELAKEYKDKYKSFYTELDETGYLLLYNLL